MNGKSKVGKKVEKKSSARVVSKIYSSFSKRSLAICQAIFLRTLQSIEDRDVLRQLLRNAVRASDLAEFQRMISNGTK